MFSKPIIVFSIDVEFGWGYYLFPHHHTMHLLSMDPTKGRKGIDDLLQIFEKNDVPATWGFVGQLLVPRDDKIITPNLPHFKQVISWSMYHHLKQNDLFNGLDVLEKINSSFQKHDIGIHGFFHIPFDCYDVKLAELELKLCTAFAKDHGLRPVSFIYPNNRIDKVSLLKEHGFKIYRGGIDCNKKIRSNINTIYNLGAVMPKMKEIIELPPSAHFSCIFSSYDVVFRLLFMLKLSSFSKRVCHIWLHPEDLLYNPTLRNSFQLILSTLANMRDQGELEIMTMRDFISRYRFN